jgi:hypothetical protein
MSRNRQSSPRRRIVLRPGVEGMESRLVLNAAGMVHTAVIHNAHHGMSTRSSRLSGRLSGEYQTASPTSDIWATTLLYQGKGSTSTARQSVLAGIIEVPNPDAGVPTLGLISIAPNGNTNDQLRLRVWSDANAGGTPTTSKLNWSVDSSSTGVYQNATGQGTLRLVYPRTHGLHAESAGGRFTMNLRGTLIPS